MESVTKSDNLFQVAGNKIFLQINQKQKTALLWRFFVVLCFIVLLFYCFFCCGGFFVIYCFVVIVLYLLFCVLLFCGYCFVI